MRLILTLTILFFAGWDRLRAAEPVLTHMHPAAVQRGTEADVKLTGKFDPWPCSVWEDVPGIVFAAGKDAGKFHVVVAAGVSAGAHLIRAFNAEGVSAPISMIVADTPQIPEAEPNDDFHSPQVLPAANATINGKHEKADDVDSFAVPLTKGQVMVAWVEAYVLAAGFDAMLRVLDEGGQTLAFNHDHITTDPFLAFTAPHDGRFIVQTMGHKYPASTEVRFAGGDDCIYRLHLSTEPFVRNTWPLAVQRGKKSTITLEGWNLAATTVEIDPAAPPAFPVVFGEVPELTKSAGPQTLEIPSAVSGRIEAAGAEDRYLINVTKGTRLEISVAARSLGSEIDAWLKIRDKDGHEIEANDDFGGSTDPRVVWTAPADGTFILGVGDLTRRCGNDCYYRLVVESAKPTAAATVAIHSVKIEPGKSAEIKVAVSLVNGFQQKLKLAARNLPAGMTAAEMDVPEKGGEVKITLAADATAPPASQPFQLVLREVESGKEDAVRYSMVTKGEDNGVPQGYQQLLINSTDLLWLTLTAPPPSPK